MSNLEQLQQAIKEARSIQVEGTHLTEGKKALQQAGYHYVEEALGAVATKQKKPEFHQRGRTTQTQQLGS